MPTLDLLAAATTKHKSMVQYLETSINRLNQRLLTEVSEEDLNGKILQAFMLNELQALEARLDELYTGMQAGDTSITVTVQSANPTLTA